ncbi:MAG: hypothetical protein R3E50_02975 [Halioglobus sp.]
MGLLPRARLRHCRRHRRSLCLPHCRWSLSGAVPGTGAPSAYWAIFQSAPDRTSTPEPCRGTCCADVRDSSNQATEPSLERRIWRRLLEKAQPSPRAKRSLKKSRKDPPARRYAASHPQEDSVLGQQPEEGGLIDLLARRVEGIQGVSRGGIRYGTDTAREQNEQ